MEKIKISVLGCCVSRDVLEYIKNKYDVERYSAFVSPYTMISGTKCNVDIDKLVALGLSNFYARSIKLDFSCGVLDYFQEVKSDWLLLDIADSRLPVIEWPNGAMITGESRRRAALNDISALIGSEMPKITYALDIPIEAHKEKLGKVLDAVLQIYPADKIILNEFYCAKEYISANMELKSFDDIKLDCLFAELNAFAEKKLENKCHIIKAPENLLGDEKHKWGLLYLHYYELYYQYAEHCLSIITKKYDKELEEKFLLELRTSYSTMFLILRQSAINKKLQLEISQKYENLIIDLKTHLEGVESEISEIRNFLFTHNSTM